MVIQPSSLAGQPSLQQTFSFQGPDTALGCGSNARYKVSITMTPVWDPQPPPVIIPTHIDRYRGEENPEEKNRVFSAGVVSCVCRDP